VARLILADWLEEHGQGDLGECLRVSWLHADHRPQRSFWALVNNPRRPAGRWLAELRRRVPFAELYRGLVRVCATPAQLLDLRIEDSLPTEYRPWLETLYLRRFHSTGDLIELARAGWLEPFTALNLDQSGLPDAAYAALALVGSGRQPHPFGHLRSLSLRFGH